MPSEQQLADHLAGALPERERAAFEAELAAHPEALRELVEQRRIEAALGALLSPNTARLEGAILASVRGASDEAIEARILAATVQSSPAPGWRGSLSTIRDWFSAGRRWRWAGAAAALLLLGAMAGLLWVGLRTTSSDRSRPEAELAAASRDPESLRDLAPLVAAPPVWTGSQEQSAWLTAFAAATAPGGNER
jgi:anti-sigma factor RsiW